MIGPDIHGGGHPWHGLCTDGTLALPGSNSMAYPQPSGADCFKLAVPGFAAPERTAGQLAADEAAGHEWLGYALLSGDSETVDGLQVYGYPLGTMKWIWAVSKTEKWLVDASALSVAAGTLSGTLALTEFGTHRADGAAGQSMSIAVSGAAGNTSAVRMKLLDIDEDGATVLIALYAFEESTHTDGKAMKPMPVSVVQLALEGGGYTGTFSSVYTSSNIGSKSAAIGAVITGTGNERFFADATSLSSYVGGATWKNTFSLEADEMARIDIDAAWTFSSTTPPDTTEYIAPTAATVHLAGSDACPGGGTVHSYDFIENTTTLADIGAQIAAAQVSRQAVVEADYEDILYDCTGAVLLADAVHIDLYSYYANFSWSTQFYETLVDTGGGVFYKIGYWQLYEQKDEYLLTINEGTGCPEYVTFVQTVNLPISASDYVYYFRKKTYGATGQVDWEYWTTQPSCGSPQYLFAPDLSTPSGSTEYSWSVDATITATIDSVPTVLGTQAFTYKSVIQSTDFLYFEAYFINVADKSNADRLEFYFSHPEAINDAPREDAACEIAFPNPSAGLYGMALVNKLPGGQTNLYKLAKRDGSTQAWSGIGNHGPHEVKAALHPVTLNVATASPTPNEDPELPDNPATPVCYV